jgi:hypothetical protein
MALNRTISKGVDTAFTALNDLAVDVTFDLVESTSYNFATGAADVTSSGSITVKGILLQDEKEVTDGSGISTKLLVKKSDIEGNINTYSYFTIGSDTYGLKDYEDNGYVIEINIRGAK